MMLQSDHIYTEEGCVSGYLEIEDGHFTHISSETTQPSEPYKNYSILPGFIDIHTHGYLGHHAQAVDKRELYALKKAMIKAGVTSFLPTVGAHFDGEYDNLKALADVIEEQQENSCGAQILGIHMEGPFLNPNRRGAFQLQQLLPIDFKKVEAYLDASRNHIIYMAVSPELDPEGELIRYLNERGIVVAGAHTTSTYDQYCEGIQYGISCSTHTGNGMRQIDRREVGALGASLLSETFYNEVICDFHHINPHMLELMFRVKKGGMDTFIMISDSTEISGFATGSYICDGMQVTIQENGLILDSEGMIMGSSHNVHYGFLNLKNKMHLPIEDIIKITSLNPAKLLGFNTTKGSIKEGKDADFIILDEKDEIVAVYVGGICEYNRKDSKAIPTISI